MISTRHRQHVLVEALGSQQILKLLEALVLTLVQLVLGGEFILKFEHVLRLSGSVGLEARERPLQVCATLFLVHGDALERLQLRQQVVSLRLQLLDLARLVLNLAGNVVDVALERENFRHKLLFLLRERINLVLSAARVLVTILQLAVELFVLAAQRLDGHLQLLDVLAHVAVVRQDVLLLELERAQSLGSSSFPVSRLRVLLLQDLVRVRLFAKLSVDVAVLASQGLDVFGQLAHFLRLELSKRSLLLDLLVEGVAFALEESDLLLALQQFPLHRLLLAGGH